MAQRKRYIRIIGWIIVILILCADIAFIIEDESLRKFSKPLFMLSLTILYLLMAVKPRPLFATALIFSWVGDVLLLWDGSAYFYMGLFSFLIMQLLYSYIFFQERGKKNYLKIGGFALILVIAWVILYLILESLEGLLLILIPIYGLAISIMLYTAVTRQGKNLSYFLIAFGAILFAVSDTVLAWNKFEYSLSYGPVLIMLTYGLAQIMIVEGRILNGGLTK